jgi:TonB family protein
VRSFNLMRTLPGCAACLLLAAVLPPARATHLDWMPENSPAPCTSAQQLESRIDSLRKSVWTLYQQEFTEAPDVRGRTLKQDVDEYLMAPASVARLEGLHTKAQAEERAHQDAALKETLAEASALVQLEVYRGNLINEYWYRQTRMGEQKSVYDALEARLPATARAQAPELRAAYAEAATQLTAALSAVNPTADEQHANTDKVHAAITAIYASYNTQRQQLGGTVGAAERASGVAPLMLTRSEPCPPAPAGTAVSAQPAPTPISVSIKPARFAPNNRADELFYPPQLRRLDLEGFVVVATTVSASGCATKAEVYSPSGAQAFDESALRWALQATYLPAERDGQAFESVMKMGVRFQMRD